MTRLLWILLVVVAPALPAQNPPDTSDAAESRQLRQEIRRRWSQRVRQDLRLSDDQVAKLQATEDRFMRRRGEIGERQRAVNQGLRDQLQPGYAANADSVRKLMDARERNRAALGQVDQDEDKEIRGYLTPVQHARYQIMREQLRKRIQEIRERRQARGQMVGPRGGVRPHQGKPRPRP
jgi:hypothetical protein